MFENCYLRVGEAPFMSCQPLTPQLIASLYALPYSPQAPLYDVLAGLGHDVPWAESFRVAPEQTAAAVATALQQLMLASRDLDAAAITAENLPAGTRARRHFEALRDLWRDHPSIVPADFAILKAFLACEASDALQPCPVIWDRNNAALTALERAVLERLESHHGPVSEQDPDFVRLIADPGSSSAPVSCLAGHVQRYLLDAKAGPAPNDNSLAVLSVRDALEECEAAAAIVQRWLADDPSLAASDIAIIAPPGSEYGLYLSETLGRAGLAASSLPSTADCRPLASEPLLHFLQCRRRPAPAMALASLYCSPLLCWPPELGMALANAVMAGDFYPPVARSLNGKSAALFALIRSAPPTTNNQLKEQIRSFQALLSDNSALRPDVDEFRYLASRVLAVLGGIGDASEAALDVALSVAGAGLAPACSRGPYHLGGISVLLAHEAPKRSYRKLLMLGFNDGAYPCPASGNPFFLDSEITAIAAATGLHLRSQCDQLGAALELFSRQLRSASEQLVILLSQRDREGNLLSPSSSLPLISRLVSGLEGPEDVIVPLSRSRGTVWDRLVAWQTCPPLERQASTVVPEHFSFDFDLLRLRLKEDGSPKAQSPSRLEKLLISPLAWILAELDADHVPWQPEALDVLLRGSLAHEVFERLFPPGTDHPSSETIKARVPELLLERIREIAPFLQTAVWSVERNMLEGEITRAAIHWSLVLRSLGAEIVGNEFWLEGELFGHPVHGKADCLLRLPDGQPVVIDYKKSSSGGRRQRLKKGWDLQVDLYRRMSVRIEEEGPERLVRVAETLTGWSSLPAVAYHTLNDGGVLLNGIDSLFCPDVELVAGDIAENAISLIKARFEALRAGRLETNTTADRTYFEKTAALGTYAFDDSPLIAAFMREDAVASISHAEQHND